jgi:hypothetical protein
MAIFVFTRGVVRNYLEDKLWGYVSKGGEYKLPQDHLKIKDRWLNVVIVISFTFIGLMVLFAWLT